MPRVMTGLIFLFAISVYYPACAAVKVIESTPSRLVLGWEMAGFDTASYSGIDGTRTNVSFDGGYIEMGDSGAPLLLGYPIYAGVPPRGGISVSVEPEETAVLRLANPLRRRTSARDARNPAYSSAAAWISEPAYTRMRDYRAVYLALRPVSPAGQGSIRVLKKARIVINFPAASHSGASWEPRGDYERMAKRLLLNFSAAQGWQNGRRGLRKTAAEERDPYPFTAGQTLASFRVGDGSRNNNEASTKENSLIRIRGKKIRELFGSGVSINSVALYASIKGEMDIEVPKDGEIPAGVFEIPILRYDLNRNGSVDDDDYFIAYVSGSSDWSYDTAFFYKINRYDDRRTYWLAVKSGGPGASMGRFAQPATAGVEFDSFENNIYLRTPQTLLEVYINNELSYGLDWVWKKFTVSRADTAISLDLPGIEADGALSLRFVRSRSSANTIDAVLDANTVCNGCDETWKSVTAGAKNPGSLVLRYRGNSDSHYELNGIYARYRRPLSVSDAAGKLEVFSSSEAGPAQYRLAKTGTGLAYIVRVPLDERAVTLIDTLRQQREYFFSDTGNMGTRYMVMVEKDIADYSDSVNMVNLPAVSDEFQIRGLRNAHNSTDYLIITHESFQSAALELAKHKAATGFKEPKLVTLGDVLNQFGGGNTDPTALRNFLLYVYRNWNSDAGLSYVTFFGAGHYDYKKVSTSSVNFMPVPYINNRICDDYYVFFDTSRHPSNDTNEVFYFIGRLPAKSLPEADEIVKKIRETEAPDAADFGAWRNRALLAADDDQQGPEQDNLRNDHYTSSEKSANIITKNRPDVDLQKLYLFEYQWDERYYKPGATRAFINEINSGTAVVNWFGHGSANQLADEVLFSKSDITTLNNNKRYPIISLFSCSIGKFDNPNDDCLASMLVRQPRAGAIVVLSSTRSVFSSNNDKLAQYFLEALFDPDGHATVGAALQTAKYKFYNGDNRFYITLGDPSIALTARNRTVSLSVRDAAGKPLNDTLRALQQVTITGTVNTPSGLKDASFSDGRAFVNLTLFNPPETARRKDGGKIINPEYILPGSPVFSAKIEVRDGEFSQQLMLPMNLAFNKPGVRIIAYTWKENDTLAGAGIIDNLIFNGSDTGSIDDTTPPTISIRPVYNAGSMDSAGMFVKNRVTARLPLTLEVSVKDSSGINVVGSGPDEGLTMEVKGALSKRSINHLFQFENFMQGVATVPFEENSLKSGTHELIISAQDLLGNVSKQSFTLDILEQAELKLDHVLNIPNPVRMGRETRFFYYHSNTPGDFDMRITIRIYSLGGRLLTVIRNPRNGEPWIPKDQRGNLLTPNVYLYQITASSSDISKSVKSKIKKLVVHPPR